MRHAPRTLSVVRGLGWSVALSLLTPMVARAEGPVVRIFGGVGQLAVDQSAGDLLVVDGEVDLHGVVRGDLLGIDARVRLGPEAVVLGEMRLVRGALRVDEGARLPPQVHLVGTHVLGRHLGAGARRRLRSGTVLMQAKQPPSEASVARMKRVERFERFSPSPGLSVRDLRGWHPGGVGLEVKSFVEQPAKLVVGGLVRLDTSDSKIKGSFQRGYRSAEGVALLSGVELTDAASASDLWSRATAMEPTLEIERSARSRVGPGAHWFFMTRGRQVVLWYQGRWVFGVETRLSTREMTLEAQEDFLERVIESLRRAWRAP